MDEYKPNSHRYKEEQKNAEKKKVEKVVGGSVRVKKKNEVSKLKDIFISEDAANIKSFVIVDVLIPAVKKAVSDIVTNGIDMILYGGNGSGRRRSPGDRVTYTNFYDRRDRDRYRSYSSSTSRGYSYDDIVFDNRGDAERVLTQLEEIVERYGVVSVADLNESAGVTGQYTDNKYGWNTLRTAEVKRVRDGYIIDLPKATALD